MPVNLLLNLDEELEEAVRRDAECAHRTFEEEVRKRLLEGVGRAYAPLTPAQIVSDDAVNIMLDLRAK